MIVGVLGGMGPLATVDLYRKIIEATPAQRDQDHLHVVIESNPAVPDRSDALLHGGADPTPLLVAGSQRLERAGADFIVVPCNTAHAFLPRVAPHVSVPLVSMIEETATTIATRWPGCTVGILATAGTVAANLYQEQFKRHGLGSIAPDEAGQHRVSRAIADVKSGLVGRAQTELLVDAALGLIARGADVLIAACTELPLIVTEADVPVPLVDPTHVLAEAAVAYGMGRRVLPAASEPKGALADASRS